MVAEIDMQTRFLRATFLKQAFNTEYRTFMKEIHTFALAHDIRTVLLDVRQRLYLEMSNQNWMQQEIIPSFKGRKWKLAYLATLQNLEMMDILRMQEATQEAPALTGIFQTEIFLSEEEAMQWLHF